jgi:hypothetical protein
MFQSLRLFLFLSTAWTLVALWPASSVATENFASRVTRVDGVEVNCLGATQHVLIRNFARANPGDPDGLNDYRDFIRNVAVVSCRSRQDRNVEYHTWCDGSGCLGATAELKSNGRCEVRDPWTGQDDQDIIDEEEWKARCLVAEDFAP